MATQHRRWRRKRLGKLMWLLLLLALIGGFGHYMPPSPQLAWETDKKSHVVGFAPNGKILVTSQGWHSGPICLWDGATGKLRFAFAHDWKHISKFKFSADSRFLAAIYDHKMLIVWGRTKGSG